MRRTRGSVLTGGALAGLVVALLAVAGPAAAETKTDSQRGVRYGELDTSRGVRALQLQLRKVGARPGPIDGRLGRRTVAAVRRFQRAKGLAVDGVVGPLTAGALRRPEAMAVTGSGLTRPQGSRRVRALQSRLRRAGARPGPIDGRYGPKTAAAVRRFQRREDLRVDGRVDKTTAVALAKRSGAGTKPKPAQGPSGRSPSRPTAPSADHSDPRDAAGAGQDKTSNGPGAAGKDDRGVGRNWLFLLAVLPLLAAVAVVVTLSRRKAAPRQADADAGTNGDNGHVPGRIPDPNGSNGHAAVTEFPMLAEDELEPASVSGQEARPWVVSPGGESADRRSRRGVGSHHAQGGSRDRVHR